MEIQIEDGATPFLDKVIAEKPKWLGSALKSAGFWAQKEIKAGIRSGAPGGHAYEPLMPIYLRKKLEAALHGSNRSNYKAMGKLVNAVGYDKSRADSGVVTVGWLSQSAVIVGSKQELGFFNRVTEHMRRAFSAAGMPLPASQDKIQVIARPTYGPMQKVLQVGAPEKVRKKLEAYLTGAQQRTAASSSRVYKVYT